MVRIGKSKKKLISLVTYPMWRPLDFMKNHFEPGMRKKYITEVSIFFSILSGVLLGTYISTDLLSNFKWAIVSLILSLIPSGYFWVGTRWWLFKYPPKVWLRLFLDIVLAGVASGYFLIFYMTARGIIGMLFFDSSFTLESWVGIIYFYNAIFCVFMAFWFFATAKGDKWILENMRKRIEHVDGEEKRKFQKRYKMEKKNIIEKGLQPDIMVNFIKYPVISGVSAIFYVADRSAGSSIWFFLLYCTICLILWYLIMDLLVRRVRHSFLEKVFAHDVESLDPSRRGGSSQHD